MFSDFLFDNNFLTFSHISGEMHEICGYLWYFKVSTLTAADASCRPLTLSERLGVLLGQRIDEVLPDPTSPVGQHPSIHQVQHFFRNPYG